MLPEDSVLVVVDMQEGFLDGINQEYTTHLGGTDGAVLDETPLSDRFINRGCLNAVNRVIADSRSVGKGLLFVKYRGQGEISKSVWYSEKDITIERDDNDGFNGTDLEKRILESGAKNVIFVGATTNACIKKTVLSALKTLKLKGFNIYVAPNAVFSSDSYQKTMGLGAIKSSGANVIDYVPYVEKGQQLEFLC